MGFRCFPGIGSGRPDLPLLLARAAHQAGVGIALLFALGLGAAAGHALHALAFLALLGPVAGLAADLPPACPAGPVLAALGAWLLWTMLYKPFALGCMLQVLFRVTEGQEPQPEWRGRLTQVSAKFRLLGEQALGWRSHIAREV